MKLFHTLSCDSYKLQLFFFFFWFMKEQHKIVYNLILMQKESDV